MMFANDKILQSWTEDSKKLYFFEMTWTMSILSRNVIQPNVSLSHEVPLEDMERKTKRFGLDLFGLEKSAKFIQGLTKFYLQCCPMIHEQENDLLFEMEENLFKIFSAKNLSCTWLEFFDFMSSLERWSAEIKYQK